MQVSRPIIYHLPEKLLVKLENYIKSNPPDWKYAMSHFYYLIEELVVLRMQIKHKDKEEKFFPLKTDHLRHVKKWNLDRYKKYLVKGKFLESDNIAIQGDKRYHYRLNPIYLQGSRAVEVPVGTVLYKSIIHQQRMDRNHWNRLQPHLKAMKDFCLEVDMDYVGAKKYAESHPDEAKRHSYLTSIAMIEDKRFRRFSRNKTNNRLDTNFTNLKSDFRQFLIGDFVSIDLANSQPFLLSQVLGEIFTTITTNTMPPVYSCSILDFDLVQWFGKQQFNYLSKIRQKEVFRDFGELLNFQKSCINGTFYEDFQRQFDGKNTLTRDQVKEMMFGILYSQNYFHEGYKSFIPYEAEKKQFAEVYPSIYPVIKALKHKDHTKLAVFLQRIEARIFIDIICPELIDRGIIPLTIHDSIIVEADQEEIALKVIRKVFKELFDVIPTFKVERLKPSIDDESSE